MKQNDSRVNGKVVVDPESPQDETPLDLSPPLPWDPVRPKPAGPSKRVRDACAREQEKRKYCRDRFENLALNSPDWTNTLVGVFDQAAGIVERCPKELEQEFAAGGLTIRLEVVAWMQLAKDELIRLRKAVEARSAATYAAAS